MNRQHMVIVLWLATLCGGLAFARGAEVLYSENFDGQGVKQGQSILDAPISWKLMSPNDPAKKSVGNAFVGTGKYGWTGKYLEGSTATAPAAENIFQKAFPAVNSGQVVLSCRAFAAGETSAGSQIGLRPALSHFFDRGGGWICTAKGWEFRVGRVHSTPYPAGEKKFGPYQVLKEVMLGAHDIAVLLRMTVDLDHNKAWGEARWTDVQGRTQEYKTAILDWDSAAGDVSNAVVSIDRRSGHTGIALDDVRVEGELRSPKPHPFEQGEHHVLRQLDGEKEPISLAATIQWISKPWIVENVETVLPYVVYMPEINRILMLVGCGRTFPAGPFAAGLVSSDDHGKTWSPRRWLSVDKAGQPNASCLLGLSYLGNGELLCYSSSERWFSADYGQTWGRSEMKASLGSWDPFLVVRGVTGRVERVALAWWKPTGVPFGSEGSGYGSATPYSQAYFRSSTDQGQTWSDDVKVPQWLGVNEVNMIVAKNGDWVAACRTDNPERFVHTAFDEYSGLGISISKDQGKTWSDLKILHEFGRHHPSMALLPDGRIVMSYVVRVGYPNTVEGFPQFGVEAVVSSDNGQTWDLEHRFVLATWVGDIKGEHFWGGGVQNSSTVLLPDGIILTAFATGFRNVPGVAPGAEGWKWDVMLVTWRIDSQPLGAK